MKDIVKQSQETITHGSHQSTIYNPRKLAEMGFPGIKSVPFSIIVLLEQVLRNYDGKKFRSKDITNLASWQKNKISEDEIPFMPTRVVLQDFTGVPSLVDLASLRTALQENGFSPDEINPRVPVDLIIDHSIQVDSYGTNNALADNMATEFKRNRERYEFLKWGQNSFDNLRVFPPGAGIIHQVNLEYLSPVSHSLDGVTFPDTLVGTDSHTTMINGLGVLGWGVGGIEAESVMLGQPIYMKIPEVVGFKLINKASAGITATDLVLRVTQMLRAKGVVEKFVEFFGSGLDSLSLADRATIANMSPEYGATMGYFPVDNETLRYLASTGRSADSIERTKAYYKALGIFRDSTTKDPIFSDMLELDLSTLVPSIAGPKRPQDRIDLTDAKQAWSTNLTVPVKDRGFGLADSSLADQSQIKGSGDILHHGSVVIAAITSCTNTSNPALMLTAGLLAKKAVKLGLKTKPWVKTSLAPGSRVVTDYLAEADLQKYLDILGFNTVGYGCTTCIGNSGPLMPQISAAIKDKDLVVCSVLSGNRNFEGRIHGDTKANFLASPPLVIAYAIAGSMNIDVSKDPLGQDQQGQDVFLKDIWPSDSDIALAEKNVLPDFYIKRYKTVLGISDRWTNLKGKSDKIFQWDEKSTYIQNPPFFSHIKDKSAGLNDIKNARALLKLGDSVTTDHISPAGIFGEISPAGQYLITKKVMPDDFNTYGSRRGNDKIMERGTFANIRIRNQLAPGTEGGFTKLFPNGKISTIFEVAQEYKKNNVPSIVLAGAEYGSGSSRDWAAKGPYLLGVKAVIAVSFERIHRSNLIGMGVLPLQFLPGDDSSSLKISGEELFSITGLHDGMLPQSRLDLTIDDRKIKVLCRLDTEIEIDYYRNGGILHTVLKEIMEKSTPAIKS
ncbi:MAG: aconitate hydratase AcnA [SAR324 cluster bacterium]|nr:aconitate hydratase AcnA [SAR324 cluster bacterium]